MGRRSFIRSPLGPRAVSLCAAADSAGCYGPLETGTHGLTTTLTDDTAPALDTRRNAYRADLAAAYLQGQVEAERFVKGTLGQILQPSVPLRKMPDATRGLETEALFGEAVTVYEEAGDLMSGKPYINVPRLCTRCVGVTKAPMRTADVGRYPT